MNHGFKLHSDGTLEITIPKGVKVSRVLVQEEMSQNGALYYSDGLMEQYKWERDIAISQLKDLGYELGEKPRKSDVPDTNIGDMISRQAAIDAVKFGITYAKAVDKNTGEVINLFEESNEELKKAAERIKNLPSADVGNMISKQQLLDDLKEMCIISFWEANEHSEECYQDIYRYIESMSSAQPEQFKSCKNCIHLGHAYMMPCKNCRRNQMMPDWHEVETERREE